MSPFKIAVTKRFNSELKKFFPGSSEKKIMSKLNTYVFEQLRSNPYSGPNIKRLKNHSPPTWRYRIKDYRFFYEINEEQGLVIFLAISHRKEAY